MQYYLEIVKQQGRISANKTTARSSVLLFPDFCGLFLLNFENALIKILNLPFPEKRSGPARLQPGRGKVWHQQCGLIFPAMVSWITSR